MSWTVGILQYRLSCHTLFNKTPHLVCILRHQNSSTLLMAFSASVFFSGQALSGPLGWHVESCGEKQIATRRSGVREEKRTRKKSFSSPLPNPPTSDPTWQFCEKLYQRKVTCTCSKDAWTVIPLLGSLSMHYSNVYDGTSGKINFHVHNFFTSCINRLSLRYSLKV